MSQKIKFLVLDDSEADLKLIKHELKSYFKNSEIECASNRKDFIIKLSHFKPDVVISDYDLPDFDGLTALKLTHEMYPYLPFIIATGSASEEFGITCIKNGAYDYVLKKHLKKLPIVVEEALSKYELILENKKAYEELRKSEEKFRRLAENAQDLIYHYEFFPKRGFTYVSPSATKITGYTPEDHYADPDLGFKIVHPDDRYILEKVVKGEMGINEPTTLRWIKKDGSIIWTEQRNVPIYDDKGNLIAVEGIARDVTERKRLEEEIKNRTEHFENLADSTTTAIFIYQGEHFVYVNKATEKLTGYSKDELFNLKFYDLVHPDFRELVKERGFKRQRGEQVPSNYEFKIVTKNGEEKWVDFTGSLITWFGKPAGLGTAYDITPSKTAIKKLEDLTNRYKTLINNAPIGILIEDAKGVILDFNKKYEEITGYSKEELLNKNVRILVSEENLSFVDENIKRIFSGEILDHIVESKRKDGSKIYVRLIETLITLPNGKKGIISFCQDLTNEYKIQKELIESEKKFRTIFENANEGICLVDENENIKDVNQKFCEIVDYTKDELLGRNFNELLIHPEELSDAKIQREKRINKQITIFERRLIKKDGKIIWVKVSASAIFDDKDCYKGSFAFFTDITEEKKLQTKLKKSEAQFRLIWENSKDGMRLTDGEGNVILVNQAFCEMVEMEREKIEGKPFTNIYLEKNRSQILAKHKERFVSGNIKTHFESLVTLHNGKKVWFEVSNSFIQIDDNLYLLGIFRDITEKKKLQEELIKSEKQFRTIWEKSNDCMVLADENTIIKLVNPAFCEMLEMSEHEILNKPLLSLLDERFHQNLDSYHQTKFLAAEFKDRFEGEMKLKNGKHIFFEAVFSKIDLFDKTLFLAVLRDISERKKLIDQLIRAKEEAEEANRLKSGFISMMSHEIRTPLNVILGFNHVLKELYLSNKQDDEIPKYFEAIEKSGNRLLNTINQILDISRIEAGEFELNYKRIDFNKKVQDAVQQIKVLADNKKINFVVTLDKKIPILILDEYCIDGVLMNLINNAVKFSYENSKIEISTYQEDDKIIFRIRDYGIGMSDEYQKHLFQPFSQEKVGYSRPYEGTGLGLALTKKFVELMNGEIKVWSKKGEGTEFQVIFPVNTDAN